MLQLRRSNTLDPNPNDQLAQQQFAHMMGATANSFGAVMNGQNPVSSFTHGMANMPGIYQISE
jgi:hypothetical protein